MKKWEDIVKDKLEGYESALPEGSLADFHARRGSSATVTHASRKWLWLPAAAVAAGLAAVLFLHRPSAPEPVIQIVRQPAAPVVAAAADTVVMEEPEKVQEAVARFAKRQPVQPASEQEQTTGNEVISEPEVFEEMAPETPVEHAELVEEALDPFVSSPFIPASSKGRKLNLKIAPAAGIVAGNGLLAALMTPLTRGGTYIPNIDSINDPIPSQENGNNTNAVGNGHGIECFFGGASGQDSYPPTENYGSSDPASVDDPVDNPIATEDPTQENQPIDVLSGDYTHYLPITAGLSARIPLTERLSVTTGLQYALYISRFAYSLSGEKTQYAHYLGVPARLDWTFASNRWLDVYAGAGMEAELCLGATLGGRKLQRDGLGLSLLGAAGLQLNISSRIGLYLEPELSWRIPSAEWKLDTYRRTHPLVFTVATGIRINFGN
jgi:hypothetical protein